MPRKDFEGVFFGKDAFFRRLRRKLLASLHCFIAKSCLTCKHLFLKFTYWRSCFWQARHTVFGSASFGLTTIPVSFSMITGKFFSFPALLNILVDPLSVFAHNWQTISNFFPFTYVFFGVPGVLFVAIFFHVAVLFPLRARAVRHGYPRGRPWERGCNVSHKAQKNMADPHAFDFFFFFFLQFFSSASRKKYDLYVLSG